MLHKMNAVVLKADYQKVFRYELILCLILLIFATDVRFNLFSRSKHRFFGIVGWVLRIAVLRSVILISLFFFQFYQMLSVPLLQVPVLAS